MITVSTAVLGCSYDPVDKGYDFDAGNSPIIYGKISNPEKETMIFIQKLSGDSGGMDLFTGRDGYFATAIKPGAYAFRVKIQKDTPFYLQNPENIGSRHYSDTLYDHTPKRVAIESGSVNYVGSLGIYGNNIEVENEKDSVDAWMRSKYPYFNGDNAKINLISE